MEPEKEKEKTSDKKSSKKDISKYVNIDPVDDITEMFYLQPDGYWANSADGRSKGRSREELVDLGLGDRIREDLNERAPLNLQQRRARGRTMRRLKNRMKHARKRAARRKANPEKLKMRARKKARLVIRKRLSAGKSYGDMSPAEKMQLDRRLLRIPDSVITRIATRQLPLVRRAEIERLARVRNAGVAKKESFDSLFEKYMDDKVEDDVKTKTSPHTKRYHQLFKKEGTVNIDKRFKIYKQPEKITESFLEEAESLMDKVDFMVESTERGLKNKSKETGVSYGILKKVFDRGLAAYKTGHRPGTTSVQWAYARVNSFVSGGTTQKTTDADLWKQHKGVSESKKTDKTDPENREHGTDSLVKILKKDTPGQAESYNQANLGSDYGFITRGSRVSFTNHTMDSMETDDDEDEDDSDEKIGTVVGSNLRHLRVRTDDGMLFLVRHNDAELVSDVVDEINIDEQFNSKFNKGKD